MEAKGWIGFVFSLWTQTLLDVYRACRVKWVCPSWFVVNENEFEGIWPHYDLKVFTSVKALWCASGKTRLCGQCEEGLHGQSNILVNPLVLSPLDRVRCFRWISVLSPCVHAEIDLVNQIWKVNFISLWYYDTWYFMILVIKICCHNCVISPTIPWW